MGSTERVYKRQSQSRSIPRVHLCAGTCQLIVICCVVPLQGRPGPDKHHHAVSTRVVTWHHDYINEAAYKTFLQTPRAYPTLKREQAVLVTLGPQTYKKNREKEDLYGREYTILNFVIRKHGKPVSNLNPVIAEYIWNPISPCQNTRRTQAYFWQQDLITFEPPLKKEHSNLMIRKLSSFATHLTSIQNARNSC